MANYWLMGKDGPLLNVRAVSDDDARHKGRRRLPQRRMAEWIDCGQRVCLPGVYREDMKYEAPRTTERGAS